MPPACLAQAYCDQYGCPDDFYDMPIWYGPVFYNNVWLAGPAYYRDWHGRRQYWILGGWRYDSWRGPHPSWWNASHYHTGPAVGRNYHRHHGDGTAASVRVWRGTQASTYYDGGGGQYFRSGSASHEAAAAAIMRPVRSVSVQAQQAPRHSAPQFHSGVGHNLVANGNRSFRTSGRGGYHGGRR